MTFYFDLTRYKYGPVPEEFTRERANGVVPQALAVGWLSPLIWFPRARPSPEFLDKLFWLCTKQHRPHWRHWMGYHICLIGLCPFRLSVWGVLERHGGTVARLGDREIFVPGKRSDLYVAPNMIYHYVARHKYRPPAKFIDAVLSYEDPPWESVTPPELETS